MKTINKLKKEIENLRFNKFAEEHKWDRFQAELLRQEILKALLKQTEEIIEEIDKWEDKNSLDVNDEPVNPSLCVISINDVEELKSALIGEERK